MKQYKIKSEDIKSIIPNKGGCMATDKITVMGELIGYMYREAPDFNNDSGWRFLSGTESQEYADISNNWAIYDLNTIANYDNAIIPYLDSTINSEFERINGTDEFKQIDN